MKTIVTDLTRSARRAPAYWRALRRAGLEQVRIDDDIFDFPLRSVVWPELVYHLRGRDIPPGQLGDWLADERELIRDGEVICPAQLQMELDLSSHPRFEYAHCDEVPAEAREGLARAIGWIDDVWPEAHTEMKELVHAIAWVKSTSGLHSTSDPKKFGMVHLNAAFYAGADVAQLATALIHESAHHALFVESAVDPLIGWDFERMIYSPVRKEMRPAIGVLHFLFASARLLQWAERLERRRERSVGAEVDRIRSLYGPPLAETLERLRACELTAAGVAILDEISQFRQQSNSRLSYV